MPIQKFASQAYNHKANNYTHNHLLFNSSGESLSSSQYSFKNGTGSTSSNCSSNDDSPVANASNNFYPNPHSLQTKSKHFAHDSDKACDKLTAQNNSKLTDHLSNGHFINMDNNFAANISDADINKIMPDSYEKLNVLYKNNSVYSTSKDKSSNTPEFNIVSPIHDFSPNHLIESTNKCKDDEKTPLLSLKTNNEMNNNQANESFLKTHLITTSTMPTLEEGNHKSESTIIMIDEDDDANCNNKDRKRVNDFLTQSSLNLGQGYYKNGQMINYNITQSTSLQNSIDSFMLGNNSRWDKEVKMADLSAINNRPHHSNFKSLELGMASCMGNVNEVQQQTTTAKSNHINSKTVTDYDEQICFFNSPSNSSYHNTFSPYDGCNLDVEMKVMNEGGSSKTFTLETSAKSANESDILKKCSKSKKKKAITNNGQNNLNILPYPMDDNLTRVAYPQKDNCPDNNSKDSKSKKAKKREKIINKNVKNEYIVKDDQGKKDINFLVAFIEGTQNSSTATTTYKDYKTSSNARSKEHGRPLIPMILKDDEADNGRKQGENCSSLVDSTFSVTTLVNEKAFLSSDDVDEQSHDTISETQSQISQTDRPTTTYKTMKKHFSSEDLRPHLFDPHALLFSPSPKVPLNIGTMALDDNSTKSDEDYSTPPQDFQENFQIVHKKQYRKENAVQPPQDFARNRGGPPRNAGRPNGGSSTWSHNQFAPRLTSGINSHGSKDGARAGYLNVAPHNKSSPVAPKDSLIPKEKSLESGKSEGLDKPADSAIATNEQISEERPHPPKPGNFKTEHFAPRGDRNNRNNPRNFKGRPPYNYNVANRAAQSSQVEATNKESNAVVESFNTELDFPPLVVCPKASKNGGETMAQSESIAHTFQSTESSEPAPDREAENHPEAASDGSDGKIESRAIEEDVKSSYASMLSKSKQHRQQLPALAVNPAAPLCKANESPTSQPTPLINSDALKFQDSSILEVSNGACQSGPASTTAAVSSTSECPPTPSSPRVIFVNAGDNSRCLTFGRSNKFRHLAPNSTDAAGENGYGEEGDEGEVKLNFTFGFDIDSPQVRDIINAKDDQNDQVASSHQRQEPQRADQPAQPPARLLEWLEAESSKLSYLAPYFADIWAQMQKNDPFPS